MRTICAVAASLTSTIGNITSGKGFPFSIELIAWQDVLIASLCKGGPLIKYGKTADILVENPPS